MSCEIQLFKIHAYTWMTNHIHLLVTPEHETSISEVFQSVGRRNAQDRSAACLSLYKTVINKADLAAIRDCTHKGWVLG